MKFNENLIILGRKVELTRRTGDKLNGLTIGEKLSYVFYDGIYLGVSLLFVEPKKGNGRKKHFVLADDYQCDLYPLSPL